MYGACIRTFSRAISVSGRPALISSWKALVAPTWSRARYRSSSFAYSVAAPFAGPLMRHLRVVSATYHGALRYAASTADAICFVEAVPPWSGVNSLPSR